MSFFKSKNDNELKTKNKVSHSSKKNEKNGKIKKNKTSGEIKTTEKVNDNIINKKESKDMEKYRNITKKKNEEHKKTKNKNTIEEKFGNEKTEMNNNSNKFSNKCINDEENSRKIGNLKKENTSNSNNINMDINKNSILTENSIMKEERNGEKKSQSVISFDNYSIDKLKTSSTLIGTTGQQEEVKVNSTVHKKNSIFRSLSHLKIRPKSTSHEKKYSSSIQEFKNEIKDINEKSKSNELKRNNSLSNSSTINNENEVKIKRFMSVPNNKNHSMKRTFSFKKKKSQASVNSINNHTNSVVPIQKNYASLDALVKETKYIIKDYDQKTGRKMINNYVIVKEVGRGCHGKVKLCYDIDTNEQYAIKIVDKRSKRRFYSRMSMNHQQPDIPNPHMEKIKREIAILKKCTHPNVVRLKEVIDSQDSEKIYIVLEYLDGGEVQWQVSQDDPRPVMDQDTTRRVFRDIVAGVGYLHHQGVVHRDIKPANLLWTSEGNLKISDFGVSCFMSTNDSTLSVKEKRNNELELAKTAGSPAFFAPELCGINDDEIPNTITQFAALLNSRSSINKSASKSSFPRTPSNISSYSKLDAIFAPRSLNSLSISHYSEGSNNKLSVTRKSSSSCSQEKRTNENSITTSKKNSTNDMFNNMSNKNLMQCNSPTYSSSSSVFQQNKSVKPRSIKWVQSPSKKSLSVSEDQNLCFRKTNQEGTNETNKCIKLKNSNDNTSIINTNTSTNPIDIPKDDNKNNFRAKVIDTVTINDSPINGSMTSIYNNKSIENLSISTNNMNISNTDLTTNINNINIKNANYKDNTNKKIDTQINLLKNENLSNNIENKTNSVIESTTETNCIINNKEIKTSVSSNEIKNIKNFNKKNKSTSSINICSDSKGKPNPISIIQNDIEKFISSESPLFIRRRCSQSSSQSNFTNRATSTYSSISKNQNSNNMENDSFYGSFRKKNFSCDNISNNQDKSLFSKSDASLSKRIDLDKNLRRSNSSSVVPTLNRSNNKSDINEPEDTTNTTVKPHIDGKAIDIWAMGVTLYCLIYGNVPFKASTEFELLSVICRKEVEYPENIKINDSLRDLFEKIFIKDPKKRIKMNEIQHHPWVTEDLNKKEREEWLAFVNLNSDPLDVTEEEVKKALTLKEKIKRKISKISHSLNHITGEFRRKTKSLPVVNNEEKLIKAKLKKNSQPNTKLNYDEENNNNNNNIYHFNSSLIGSTQKIIEEDESNKKRDTSEISEINEIDVNEESSGEILYITFDRKSKKE